MKEYDYSIVTDNWDQTGSFSAHNVREMMRNIYRLIDLKDSKTESAKINITIKKDDDERKTDVQV